MLWQGVSKALRTPAKCICTIRPSTHLIENLRAEGEGAGKRKEKKYCFMGLFLKREKKGGKEKGITYSCFYGLSFNSIPVTLNTSQNGSDWSSITDGLSIGSQGAGGVSRSLPWSHALPSVSQLSSEKNCPCCALVVCGRYKHQCTSLPAYQYGNVHY